MKRCSRCHLKLPVEAFNKNSASDDGLFQYCKQCLSEYQKERRRKKRVVADEFRMGLFPKEFSKRVTACDTCVCKEVCEDRVKRGLYVACEHPTQDDYLRAALVEARCATR